MKKNKLTIQAVITVFGLSVLSGCGAGDKDPGEPPAEVVNGEIMPGMTSRPLRM